MLTKEQFFACVPAASYEDVEIPGAGTVRVRTITVGERDRFERAAQGKSVGYIRAAAVVASVVDENGDPVFTYDDMAQIDALPARYVEPILEAFQRLNGVTEADVDALKKNSPTTP